MGIPITQGQQKDFLNQVRTESALLSYANLSRKHVQLHGRPQLGAKSVAI